MIHDVFMLSAVAVFSAVEVTAIKPHQCEVTHPPSSYTSSITTSPNRLYERDQKW